MADDGGVGDWGPAVHTDRLGDQMRLLTARVDAFRLHAQLRPAARTVVQGESKGLEGPTPPVVVERLPVGHVLGEQLGRGDVGCQRRLGPPSNGPAPVEHERGLVRLRGLLGAERPGHRVRTDPVLECGRDAVEPRLVKRVGKHWGGRGVLFQDAASDQWLVVRRHVVGRRCGRRRLDRVLTEEPEQPGRHVSLCQLRGPRNEVPPEVDDESGTDERRHPRPG